MKLLVFPFLLTVAGLLTASCAEDGSTGRSPFPLQLMCRNSARVLACIAFATVGGRDGQDVSGLATWSTSDTTIATINSTGLVTALRSGEVAIRVATRTAPRFKWCGLFPIRAFMEPPGPSRAGCSAWWLLPGVLMEILNGPNAGRAMTTSADGRFYMTDLHDGPFMICLSKLVQDSRVPVVDARRRRTDPDAHRLAARPLVAAAAGTALGTLPTGATAPVAAASAAEVRLQQMRERVDVAELATLHAEQVRIGRAAAAVGRLRRRRCRTPRPIRSCRPR